MLNANKHGIRKTRKKCAESDKYCSPKSEHQESHKKSQKHCKFRKNVKFPPNPPSAKLCQNIVLDFHNTSLEVFEEASCVICGKLSPICEMEEFSF